MKIVALGQLPPAPAYAAWATLIGVAAVIFWATLQPPKLRG